MDGYALFYELKSLNPKLPIIISSGFGDGEVNSSIANEDFAGLISKPYNPVQLREILEKSWRVYSVQIYKLIKNNLK